MSDSHMPPAPSAATGWRMRLAKSTSAVLSGSKVRGTFRVVAVEESDWGFQATMNATVEREGGDKPVCVAELVFRYYG